MSAGAGLAAVIMAGGLAIVSGIGASALFGPESYSGAWPWRIAAFVVWALCGAGATVILHQIGEGLPTE